MSTFKKMLLLSLIIFSLSLVYYVIPVEVEGVVEHKVINGYYGNTCDSIFNAPHPAESWILADDEDFEPFFTQGDMNLYVNDSLKEFLERKYASVDYYVGVRLISDDPANGVYEGETCTYYVSLEDFNKVKIDNKVKCKIPRYRFARIDNITIL
ncbi:hypothetical protein [Methanolobus profundi]|uniref:Uncharacterized protein n=1 Tax=Methanolobus profundi TaxID=487685 RepID=A0A1I4R495_9EURY|nr:hypothetical protein [Methanolobus profundi]SFM47112.1 hypothetical protein SAMN04488696_1355 [Methanolobus profundi]